MENWEDKNVSVDGSFPPTAFVNRESREETLKHYLRLIQPVDVPFHHLIQPTDVPFHHFLPEAIHDLVKSFMKASDRRETPNMPFNSYNIIYLHPKLDCLILPKEAIYESSKYYYIALCALFIFQDSKHKARFTLFNK